MRIDIPTPTFPEDDRPRALYARLSRIDFLSASPYRRASIEFDGVDADQVDDSRNPEGELFNEKEFKAFALTRIVTTPRRFEEVMGAPPVVGSWFRLKIEPSGDGLMTWQAQLGPLGYYAQTRVVTVGGSPLVDPLSPPSGPSPKSLGAASAKEPLPTCIAELSNRFTVGRKWSDIEPILKSIAAPTEIVVRDVGQASFVSFVDKEGRSYLHFDTGLPVSWNGYTAPKKLDVDLAKDQIVILSHWDWDHLHAPCTIKDLYDAKWIVPSQRLGPGAARIAMAIAKRGNLFVWPYGAAFTTPDLSIAECAGKFGNANNTGLTLRARLRAGREALLTGDADYSTLPATMTAPVDYLLVSHHGAAMPVGSVPIARIGTVGFAAVSFGGGNTYRHPNAATELTHFKSGWGNWRPTARRPGIRPRGDRKFV
ncbi:metallo-hydrolase/oxidoreductase [Rhizobium sullae]|uniref:Metallo-hydrolase/oxidoreductase n=1 Tax=Rhizobium sullae TaxID=50338 RepID=A0ABY5XE28_RHISU|nr:hypothetical protein [Rhizobium sullae]UWU12800.1 metallo-hydrolase/oxidoreductase [Rhizobium sullae]